jgi:pectate lyase
VDVYNNHFKTAPGSAIPYGYTFGAGVESHLHAEANAFTLPAEIPAGSVIGYFKGKAIITSGNAVNGKIVDLRAAYNAVAPADRQVGADDSWAPVLRTHVNAAQAIPALLADAVGPVFTAGETH